jgi:FixJ family two-component response regulator
MEGKALISIVDDDESIRRALERLFRWAGFDVEAFASGEEFLSSGNLRGTSCLLLDLRMSGMSGLDLQSRINFGPYQIPIIFLTAHDDPPSREQALKAGAINFVCKPFDEGSLIRDVNSAIDQHGSNTH